MKIQTKTALLFTALTGVILLLLGIFVYVLTSRFAATDFYKRLEIRAFIAARVKLERDETSVTAYDDIRKAHLEMLEGEKEYFIEVNDTQTMQAQPSDLKLPQHFYNQVVLRGVANYESGDTFYTAIYYPDNEGNFIVLLSARNEPLTSTLLNLRYLLIAGFLTSMVIVFTFGLFFSRQTFAPVRNIIRRVKTINAENLSVELPPYDGGDEIAQLSNTFNDMLYRLRTAFETQQNFVSNASHEFRTPVTTILGEADLALAGERSVPELKQSMQNILHEAEKLKLIIDSLLSLAQTGFDGKKQRWLLVRMDELLLEVKHNVENITNRHNVQLVLDNLPEDETFLEVEGNADLLKLAISNIVLNACKYSDNKQVTVNIHSDGQKLQVIIEDQGIGIPAKEVKDIFTPFFRASNVQTYRGYGIGLPLSMNIIRLHHGNISVLSVQDTGTRVVVDLPVYVKIG